MSEANQANEDPSQAVTMSSAQFQQALRHAYEKGLQDMRAACSEKVHDLMYRRVLKNEDSYGHAQAVRASVMAVKTTPLLERFERTAHDCDPASATAVGDKPEQSPGVSRTVPVGRARTPRPSCP